MAFSWTEERINYLRENAGKLKVAEIAVALGTNITVVRNMAVRQKLSLRVRGYTKEQMDQVRELYASGEELSIRDICRLTGLAYSVVSYIIYANNRKAKPQFRRIKFLEFEAEDGVKRVVQEELIDVERTSLGSLIRGSSSDVWLLDGSHFSARNITSVERIISSLRAF